MSTVENTATVRVIAFWRAAPGRQEAVRQILSELASATRREPGCLRFEVLEAVDQPGSYVLLEQYAGGGGHAAHLATAHFRTLVLERAVPLLQHRDVHPYQTLERQTA
ncbi:MAG: hypothetical protein V7603_5505 [Micromonosporaceae bacterium]